MSYREECQGCLRIFEGQDVFFCLRELVVCGLQKNYLIPGNSIWRHYSNEGCEYLPEDYLFYKAFLECVRRGWMTKEEVPPVEVLDPSKCECCSSTEGVESEPARTCYARKTGHPDPNRNLYLCRSCAEEHHAEWNSRWDEYHSGLL